MSFTTTLAPEFSTKTRVRGRWYAEDGRVSIVSRSPAVIDAVVQGTVTYRVHLSAGLEHGTTLVTGSCTCPHASGVEPCKHLWAALLVAEREGWPALNVPPARGHVQFQLIESADADVEAVDVPTPGRNEQPGPAPSQRHGQADRAGQPARRDRHPPSGSARFFDHLEVQILTHTPQPSEFDETGELLYVIDAEASRANEAGVLHVMRRHRKQDGDWGRPRPTRLAASSIMHASEEDRLILSSVLGAIGAPSPDGWFDQHQLAGESSAFLLTDGLTAELLPILARGGRAYLRERSADRDLHALRWDDGPAWVFRPDVATTSAGFLVSGSFHRPDSRLDLQEPVLVVSAGFLVTRSHIARLDPATNPALLMTLRSNGPVEVSRRDSATLAHVLARAGVPSAHLPEELRVLEVDVDPIPRLALAPARWGPTNQLDATVTFDYDGSIVANDRALVTFDDRRRRIVRRRPAREGDRFSRLFVEGFRSSSDYGGQPTIRLPTKMLASAAYALLAEGWHVEGHGHVYRSASAIKLSVSSGTDWFDLKATVRFSGADVPILDVLEAIKRKEPTVRLGDGSVGLLPEEWLARYAPLAAAAEVHDGQLRFRRLQAALLDALLDARSSDSDVSVDEEFARVRRELETFSRIEPAPAPADFCGTLRDYQREGLGWFQYLRRFGFGGCLADDMGLGKTIMVLALLAWWRRERTGPAAGPRPSLIVVPRSLVLNWMAEAKRFSPTLEVLDYSGTGRTSNRGRLDEYDIVLTTYGTLRRDVVDLRETEFEYVILDEAQAIKNANTASSKAARLLRGRHRLALSGTPIENHLGELWSLVEFLNPGLLGRASVFQRAASTSGADAETMALVARGLRPFILRRTKAQVARELPPRTEQTLFCELSKPEREFYDALRRHYRDSLLARVARVGMARSKMHVLEGLLRLRQAACHTGLVDATRRDESSAKFNVLLPRLRELVEEGHKALVFSQFTTLLGLLRARLDREKIPYEYLDGRTHDRQARVDHFQTDADCSLFLISLKAGGVGLNLTAAGYVFLLDPWWNPAVEAQAIDRTHRIGQTREVFAYRVIAADTVEEKVLALQQSKRTLADAVLRADAGGLRNLQREDLELLLS